MNQKTKDQLDISHIIEKFENEEAKDSHRKGAFKIDKPFDEALDAILKAKPGAKAPKGEGNRHGNS